MKRDLIGPPVDAPVLPEGLYYRITAHTQFETVIWRVTICKPTEIKKWHGKKETWEAELAYSTSEGHVNDTEALIRQACERAYDAMVHKEQRRAIIEKYSGKQSGQ